MIIRVFETSDYFKVCEWWKAHKIEVPSLDRLPETGFIIDDLCAGFIYRTDSDIALMEYIISNPQSNKEQRSEALDLLIDTIIKASKQMGFENVVAFSTHEKFIKRLNRNHFGISEQKFNCLTRMI